MKNIRAYLTIAVVSPHAGGGIRLFDEQCRPSGCCLCAAAVRLVFCWSAVKAVLAAMDSDAHRDTTTAVCSFPVRLVLA